MATHANYKNSCCSPRGWSKSAAVQLRVLTQPPPQCTRVSCAKVCTRPGDLVRVCTPTWSKQCATREGRNSLEVHGWTKQTETTYMYGRTSSSCLSWHLSASSRFAAPGANTFGGAWGAQLK